MLYRVVQLRLIMSVLVIFSVPSTIAAASTPAFWVVSKGAAKVYLFGSMHFGRSDFYPLPGVIEHAFAESSRLVVEVDLLHLGADAQQIVFRHAGLPRGTILKDVISAETYTALAEQAARNRVPIAAFHRFQPWYVTLTLVEAEIRKTDLQQQLGIDLYFLRRAAASNKNVDELETFDSQLSLFSSIALNDQETFLNQTLNDLKNSGGYLKAAADAWVLGDIERLENALVEPFREHSETAPLFEKMFTQRNVKMATEIKRHLDTGEKTFVVVGVGHMLGRDGIVELLRSQEILVRRIPTAAESKTSASGAVLPNPPETGLP